ncbi:PREDICTED: glutamate receptor ionotropic, kainate 5-like isoform X2 [Vollenhovia emeryi]|uniref:glutamate receptor ionotropic, kainate 5-like isoform X2 n=1 Tax=Vollenhovia emeryi TaxID=411798 RepID=UPI0005F4ABAD|nr:PREDICTED: glutamate receptor ionotropic, kainate 5-like isoform X2 [Vollenhovia emeryi]
MLFVILCIFAISLNTAYSRRMDDVILQFLVDATPVLLSPLRISLHTCIGYEDTIRLSREMSNHRLIHGIHNFVKDIKERIHDNLEHQNLYMLDLDCDYAIELLRQDRRTMIDNSNITSTYNNSILDIFEELAVYPDSDVILARRLNGDFFQIKSVYRPSPQRAVIWENRGNWTVKDGLRMSTFDASSARRRNLQQTALKSCLVMSYPDTMNHLTDFMHNTLDPMTKVNYIWVHHLMNRINATITFNVVYKNWGRKTKNGSWDGMVGMLQRREIDIGGTAMFILDERIPIVEYIHLYTRTKLCFIFRRPLLSTMKNIFIMPFQQSVWIAIAAFLVLVFCLLHLSIKWEHYRGASKTSAAYWNQLNNSKPTVTDNLFIVLGAVSQQGYSYEPYRVPSRIITLMLLLTSLNLYAAYTANIVALLQTPTDSIKTLSDLLHSPLTLGSYDLPVNRYYFKNTNLQDPVRTAILQKVDSKSNWISLEEGVRRIQTESFAFHGTRSPIYTIVQQTYQENEKCGLTEMDYLSQIYPLLAVQKQSPYLELIKNGALKLWENGLMFRDEYRLYVNKPTCSSQTGFITIGFTECYFAIVAMGYGTLLSVVVFILELLWHKIRSRSIKEQTVLEETATEGANLSTLKYID